MYLEGILEWHRIFKDYITCGISKHCLIYTFPLEALNTFYSLGAVVTELYTKINLKYRIVLVNENMKY